MLVADILRNEDVDKSGADVAVCGERQDCVFTVQIERLKGKFMSKIIDITSLIFILYLLNTVSF